MGTSNEFALRLMHLNTIVFNLKLAHVMCRQQALNRANIASGLCRQTTSLGHNELRHSVTNDLYNLVPNDLHLPQ